MIIPAIKKRRSIRKYKPQPVSKKDLEELIMAAQFAPNGRHQRAWEFLIIKDQVIKKKIYQIFGQDFLFEAPILIIPLIDTTKTDLGIQDLAVASENIFLQAAALGLGTVWKNVRSDDASKIRKILNIPEKYLMINIIPVGYPAEKISPHNNQDFQKSKIHWEKW